MRGMVAASIEVTGPARDVHSGNDGGVFSEPMADLFKLLASLTEAPGGAAAAAAALSGGGAGGGKAAANGGGKAANGSGNGSGGAALAPATPAVSGNGDSGALTDGLDADAGAADGASAAALQCGCEDGGLDGADGAPVGTRIRVPGFYDGVRPALIGAAWRGLEDCDEFSLEAYQ